MRDPITRRDVVARIDEAMAFVDGDFDIEQIADTLIARHGLDDAVDAEDFWEVVLAHESAAPASVRDVVWPLVQAARGRTAEWTDDESGVTVRVTGMSPVSPILPQPLARAEVVGIDTVRLAADDLTWESLAAAVADAREDADGRRVDVERELMQAGIAVDQVAARMTQVEARRHRAVRAASAAGLSDARIAELCGLTRQSVHRIRKNGTPG